MLIIYGEINISWLWEVTILSSVSHNIEFNCSSVVFLINTHLHCFG